MSCKKVSAVFVVVVCLILVLLNSDSKKMPPEYPALDRCEIVIGDPNAPIKIIEYSTLTCSHCATFHKETLPLLQKHYIETGKIAILFRNYPNDRQSLQAATIVHGLPLSQREKAIRNLFERQARWMHSNSLTEIAEICGISEESCHSFLDNDTLLNEVLTARIETDKYITLTGTPTFIIQGTVYDHSLSFEELKGILENLSYSQSLKSLTSTLS